jgi:ribosome maturation protein Sdo1
MALNVHLASAICFRTASAGIRASGQDFQKVFDTGI